MTQPKPIEMTIEERTKLIERIKNNTLTTKDAEILVGVIDFNWWLQSSIQEKNISIDKLRRAFGSTSEKRKKTDNGAAKTKQNDADKQETVASDSAAGEKVTDNDTDVPQEPPADTTTNTRKQGTNNGRMGHDAYTEAQTVAISAPYKPGAPCPEEDCSGKLYLVEPGNVIKIVGQSFAKAIKYIFETMRCNLCNKYFSGEMPEHVCPEKYDPALKAELCVHKYFLGVPSYRLEDYQNFIGIPLPDSTQFDKMEDVANAGYPAFQYLEQCAANGRLLHGDDTKVRIQSLIQANKNLPKKARTGMFTTGIISFYKEVRIYLFYSSRKHCGENVSGLLEKRDPSLPPIKYMCDALSCNMPANLNVIYINCMVHGRRNFTDIDQYFPEECTKVIDIIATIYKHDDEAKKQSLDDDARLEYHQKHSSALMDNLHTWLKKLLDDHLVESNSELGRAFKYMLNHWHKLTQFLRIPGAPLDNNIMEQGLKVPIRVRKNSLFYGTEHSAYIGSILQSLICTCIANKQNPVKYLIALQEYKAEVRLNARAWMPWNYQETIAAINNQLTRRAAAA